MLTSTLMQTLLASVMPTVARELGQSWLYGWVFAAYLAGSTLLLPLAGQLADLVGRRRMFQVGVLSYGLGTVAVASARSMPVLVAARLGQGLGAALLAPAALAAIVDLTGGPDGEPARRRLLSLMGVLQMVANITGPILGAWCTSRLGWRWAVLVTLPPTLLATLLGTTLPGRTRPAPRRFWTQLDWRQPLPLLRHIPAARAVGGSAARAGATLMATVAFLPLHVTAAGVHTGQALSVLMVGAGGGSLLTGLVGRWPRSAMRAGWALTGAGLGAVALLSSPPALLAASGTVGIGLGIVQPLMLLWAQRSGGEQVAQFSSLVQLGRNTGGAAATFLLAGLVVRHVTGIAFMILAVVALAGALRRQW